MTQLTFRSENYNYNFNSNTGYFERWGKEEKDDPQQGPGPEILDIEISSGGDCKGNCPFCYKCNGGNQPTINMTLKHLQAIVSRFNYPISQVAFGIMNYTTNPEMLDILKWCRSVGIIPNMTMHGLDDLSEKDIEDISTLCGAVAVSIYNKEKSFDLVKRLTDAGLKQVNIHFMLSQETYERAMQLVEDIKTDSRLAKLKAVVFLRYKDKGRGVGKFNSIKDPNIYKDLLNKFAKSNVGIGFDSCSGPKVEDAMKLQLVDSLKLCKNSIQKGLVNLIHNKQLQHIEPCESGLFSGYINCEGYFFPCSFMEGEGDWKEGLRVIDFDSFNQIWNHEKVIKWRESLLSKCRNCPQYN